MAAKAAIRAWVLVAAVIVVTVVGGRLLLENHFETRIDAALMNIRNFRTEYESVSVSFLDGGYQLRGISLSNASGQIPVPFFQAEKLILAMDWSALLKGALVCRITVEKPVVNFVKGPDAETSQTSAPFDWLEIVRNIAPFPVNEVYVMDGAVRYHDYHSTPRVSLGIQQIDLTAKNLHNVNNEEKILSATVEGSAVAYESAVKLDMELNAFYKMPMFKLSVGLTNLDLNHLNDFLKAYGNVDVQHGLFSMYAEAGTRSDKITGFVKPVIEDINVASWSNEDADLDVLKPRSGGAGPAFRMTSGTETFPAEITFEGDLQEAGINIWTATGITLHNAFIEALMPALESSVKENDPNPVLRPRARPSSKVRQDEQPEKKPGFLKRLFKRKEAKGK